ncbi:MAG: UDP-N-acetylmuramate dehydrogenase [Clostridia bacterium]|nr:UDP-N-acetylmuramate dehydrogenase [Clostridia bacterium]
MDSFVNMLNEHQIPFRKDCTLAELSTFKIGGPVEYVFYPESVIQCRALIQLSRDQGKKLVYLGNGSNILGSDAGCEEWILKTDRLDEIRLSNDGVMTVGAGIKTVKASSFAAKSGFSGLEFAHGIPGTVGGAVFMNAGAYGGAMEQIVLRTHYLDDNGNEQILEGKDHQFGYRKSFFIQHPEYLIVSVDLQLKKGDSAEIYSLINDLQQRRRDKQPLEYPSAGSTFKRPEGYFAGKLIEDSGLKGFRIGDAQVSEKHAGFVINRGHATGSEVRQLIKHIQKTVQENYGVELECEVRYLGSE